MKTPLHALVIIYFLQSLILFLYCKFATQSFVFYTFSRFLKTFPSLSSKEFKFSHVLQRFVPALNRYSSLCMFFHSPPPRASLLFSRCYLSNASPRDPPRVAYERYSAGTWVFMERWTCTARRRAGLLFVAVVVLRIVRLLCNVVFLESGHFAADMLTVTRQRSYKVRSEILLRNLNR